jgi:ribosome-binding factor A
MRRRFQSKDAPSRDVLSNYRAQIDADDGADPRDFLKKETHFRGAGRKAQQLCAQVAETLQQVLGESADAIVQSLHVASVVPAPDASQLLVIVAPAVGAQFSAAEAEEAIARAGGWLRSEVAAAITRKRAPQLVFRVLPVVEQEAQS